MPRVMSMWAKGRGYLSTLPAPFPHNQDFLTGSPMEGTWITGRDARFSHLSAQVGRAISIGSVLSDNHDAFFFFLRK